MATANIGRTFLAGIGKSIDLRALDKSIGNPWQLNTTYRNGRHDVRKGFGLLRDVSTTLTAYRPDGASGGYTAILGSHVRTTDQGHVQVTSVVRVEGFTANTSESDAGVWLPGSLGQQGAFLAIVVYDVTTDAFQEYLLVKSTEETAASVARLPTILPWGQTQTNRDLSDYLRCPDNLPTVSWAIILDELYACIPGIGTWRIGSIDPCHQVVHPQTLDAVPGNEARADNHQGESCTVTRVVPKQGFLTDGLVYLTQSQVGTAQAVCNYENRMVYAIGRTLLFSDQDFPQHILANNQQTIPSERPITSLSVVKGQILVHTETETWLYQPADAADLVSGGRLYNLSKTIGCMSPRHVSVSPDAVLWMDRWGVYGNTGGTNIETLSEAIDPWFTQTDVQNPVTSRVWAATTTLTTDQPKARWSMAHEVQDARLAWDDRTSTLFATMPSMTLIWQKDNGWSTWGFDTYVGNTVQSQTAIGQPQILAWEGSVYAVSLTSTVYTDAISGDVYTLSSLSHYLLGRGGAMDRSSTAQEDSRTIQGQWVVGETNKATANSVRVGKPIRRPIGYATDTVAATEETWWLPIEVACPATPSLSIRFTIHNHWRFLCDGSAPGQIAYVLPNDRVQSSSGYVNGVGEIKAYTGGGVASDNGLQLRLFFDGAAAPALSWAWHPNLNLQVSQYRPLVYIPVVRLTGATASDTVFEIINTFDAADFDPLGANTAMQQVWWTTPDPVAQSLADDATAKPVDWALKTREIGDGKSQLLCRGSFIKLRSNGSATVKTASKTDVLNSLTTSDYQDYAGQAPTWQFDSNATSITDKMNERARMLSTTSIPSHKVGGSVAKWGNTANAGQGNMLIDDPAVDTIAVSEGVQGEQFSTLLYGTLGAPAEALSVQSSDIEVRVIGGRRRNGR